MSPSFVMKKIETNEESNTNVTDVAVPWGKYLSLRSFAEEYLMASRRLPKIYNTRSER